MAHRIPVARVARLVGLSRSQVQRLIQAGTLSTFDGTVDLDDLMAVFPDTDWDTDGELRRVEEVKNRAFGRRLVELALPDKHVLAERLYRLSRKYAAAERRAERFALRLRWLEERLEAMAAEGGGAAAVAADLRDWLRHEQMDGAKESDRIEAVLAGEGMMEVMSARVRLEPDGRDFFVEGNDTVLEAALGAGIPLEYGCSNGNCGACRARLVSGEVRKVHPHDFALSATDKADGAFLMCSYTAVTDLVIEAGTMGVSDIPRQIIPTRVRAVEHLGEDVAALHLTTPRSQRLRFLAGQTVTLDAGGVSGSYYVASCPCDGRQVTVHVRRTNDPFARRVFADLGHNEDVTIDGPGGDVVYDSVLGRKLVFVAWDDGFAPIGSLVQHALSLDEGQPMRLLRVADEVGLYRDNQCRSWADAYDTLEYTVLSAEGGAGAVADRVAAACGDIAVSDVYAAGPKAFLDALRGRAVGLGMPEGAWHGLVMDRDSNAG